MAGIQLEVDIRDQVVGDVLERIVRNMGSTRPALFDIGEHLQGSVEERFRSEADPAGNPWEPLTAFTPGQQAKRPDPDRDGRRRPARLHPLPGRRRRPGARHQQDIRRHPPAGRYHSGQERRAALAIGNPKKALLPLVQQVEIPARPYLGLSKEDR